MHSNLQETATKLALLLVTTKTECKQSPKIVKRKSPSVYVHLNIQENIFMHNCYNCQAPTYLSKLPLHGKMPDYGLFNAESSNFLRLSQRGEERKG